MNNNEPKKLKKEMAVRLFLTGVALCTVVVAAVAWFANNEYVEATGMEVNAETDVGLVITTKAEDIASITQADLYGEVICYDTSVTTSPAQHVSTLEPNKVASPKSNSYLEYVSNSSVVDRNTGMAEKSKELDYTVVEYDKRSTYCSDKNIYIASWPQEMPGQKIVATLEDNIVPTIVARKAFSIDFYSRYKGGSWYYRGTLNLANKNNYITIYTGTAKKPIPGHKTAYIQVLMRSYYDGGLGDDENSSYITTTTLSNLDETDPIQKEELKTKVTFKAVSN